MEVASLVRQLKKKSKNYMFKICIPNCKIYILREQSHGQNVVNVKNREINK